MSDNPEPVLQLLRGFLALGLHRFAHLRLVQEPLDLGHGRLVCHVVLRLQASANNRIEVVQLPERSLRVNTWLDKPLLYHRVPRGISRYHVRHQLVFCAGGLQVLDREVTMFLPHIDVVLVGKHLVQPRPLHVVVVAYHAVRSNAGLLG